MEYYVGIDIGTSSAKLVLVDRQGAIIKSNSRRYDITESISGWREIEPEVWMEAVEGGLSELLQGVASMDAISIGVTGQMHTIVFLDESGNSIRPAIMWNDTRTAPMLPEVKERISSIKEISYIANIISTGSPAMNLLWLKNNEPESFSKIKKFLIGPDYIVYRLTGKYQTDYCEASTSSLCDLKKGKWSPEMRELLGLKEEIYPEIKGTGELAGTLLPKYQEKYGLSKQTKVIVGTGDNPAAAICTGCLTERIPVLSLGTSGVLMFLKEKITFQDKGKNILFSIDGKQISVLVQGVVQSCGNSLSWWIEKVQQTKDYDVEFGNVDISRLGENSVIFYPHLTGDKTIYADPDLRGCFIGIGTGTTRKDMTIAVIEGICFAIKQLIAEMAVPAEKLIDLHVTGGGSKNDIWMQILADVLQTSVVQMENKTGAAYGIALLAASVVTKDKSIEQIAGQTLAVQRKFLPRQYNAGLYDKKYKRYMKIYDALKEIMEP